MKMSNSLKQASEEVYREVRKLEARLNDYLQDEELFVKSLRVCIEQFKMLHCKIEKSEDNIKSEKIGELIKLTEEAEKAFCEAITKEGKAEHERSHLLESYGALFLTLQNLRKNFNT